jgi:uncharacterized protein YndB with AHSA1/START domain
LKEIAMAATLEPDLSERRLRLSVERDMAASPAALFRAWTQQFDLWFAAPGSVIMDSGINKVFYFETDFEGKRIPVTAGSLSCSQTLLEITWLTAATLGAETW